MKAVLRILRSEENRLEPMSKADALQMLLQQVYSSDFPDSARRVFALKAAMLETASFYTMYCNMNPDAALCAWNGLKKYEGEGR